MVAPLNMATKILSPAIEQVIDDFVVLGAEGIGLLIIDNVLAKDVGHL
jgi:hypothetical protein